MGQLGAQQVSGGAVEDTFGASRLIEIGFKVETGGANTLSITPPAWRHDVTRDVDLIEEVARLRGYDVLSDTLTAFRPSAAPDAPLHAVRAGVRRALVAAGFAEVQPLPFVRGDDATHIRVTNPLADDEPHLRTSMLDTLAKRAEFNLARREGNLRLFEVGSVFLPDGSGVREECRVGALMMGARRPVHFTEPRPPSFDAWDAKAVAMLVTGAAFPGAATQLEGGEGAQLWSIRVGATAVGEVRALSLDAPPWAAPVFGVEVALGHLPVAAVAPPGENLHTLAGEAIQGMAVRRYHPLPVTPSAEFDLAFLVPNEFPAAVIEATLRKTGGELLERISLFDEFRGPGVPDGQRSLAWRLTFRHAERTLNDKELAGRRQKLISTVEKEHGVVARIS